MQICICRIRVEEWIKISDLLFFQEGPGVRNTQYTQSGVKLLNVANLVNGKVDLSTSDRYISEDEAYGRYKHFLCDDGDFIIASSGIKVEYFDRKMGFVDSSMLPLCMNTSTIRFKVIDSKRLNIKYFMYYLKSIHFKQQLSKFITGSAQLNFGPSHLKKMNMPLVSLKEQNDIVEKLSKVELLLDKYNGEIKLLDELIKARFVEMFGNPVSNSKDLPVQKMNNVAPICQYDGSFEESVWLLNLDMVESQTGRIINYNIVSKDEIGGSVCTFDENNVLYSKLRPYLNKVVVPDGKGYATSELVPLRPDPKIINRIYLAYLLRSNEFVEMIKEKVAGAKMPRVSMSDFREFNIPVPPLELQNQFASFVEEIDKSRLLSNHSLFLIKSLIF